MKNKLLNIIALSGLGLALAGCSNIGVPDETGFLMQKDFVADKTFVITHLNGELLDDTLNSTMKFDKDKTITGRGFCNLYRGNYEVAYNNLFHVDSVRFSSKACSNINMQADKNLESILKENIVVSKSTLGYKFTSVNGSFNLMEIQVVTRP